MKLYVKNPTMTVAEAGHIGGTKVFEKLGREHYVELGKKSGAHLRETRGSAWFQEIGKRGGDTNVANGVDFAELGRKGGNKNKLKGREYFRAIGRKGGSAPRVNRKIKAETKGADESLLGKE